MTATKRVSHLEQTRPSADLTAGACRRPPKPKAAARTAAERPASWGGTVGKAPNADIAAPASSTVRRGAAGTQIAARSAATVDRAPEVTALLATYGIRQELGRPRERILTALARLQAALVAAGPDIAAQVQSMAAHDARRQVFDLEVLLRLYKKRYPEVDDSHRERFKALEDLLGDYTTRLPILATAKLRGAPEQVIAELDKETSQSLQALTVEVENQWRPNGESGRVPAIEGLLKGLAAAIWDDAATDRSYLLHAMAKHLKKVDETEFPMTDLVGGMHALRRQLRWFTLGVEAVDGLIQLDPTRNPIAAYASMNTDPIANDKNVPRIPPTREESPVMFPKSLFLATMRVIFDLGALKDEMESIEFIGKAYAACGAAKSEKEGIKKALELLGEPKDRLERISEEAAAIYDQLRHRGLLGAMRDELVG